MRRDWDDRAHADAFYYSTWKVGHKWDPDEFFESGERDCQLFVDSIIKELGLEPRDSAMLELGCGVGRMTKALARRFRSVHATDVSPEMVVQASSLCPELNNVTWEVSDGFDLSTVPDGSLDFAFSFLVSYMCRIKRLSSTTSPRCSESSGPRVGSYSSTTAPPDGRSGGGDG